MQFDEMGLEAPVLAALAARGITTPTAVQSATWPVFQSGSDLLVQSGTGTGKTLAYLIPVLARIDRTSKALQALILAPTQELAVQIQGQIDLVTQGTEIRSLSLLGGVNLLRQLDALKSKPHLIVGTPGRVLELLEKKKITGHFLTVVILDEADRLLDVTSAATTRAILKTTLKSRQLALFSASLPSVTRAAAADLLRDPQDVTLDREAPIPAGIAHWKMLTERQEKTDTVRKLLHALGSSRVLVFLNKPDQIELVASKLRHHGVEAESLHGTRFKQDRQAAMKAFSSGASPVLVASDLAARGLHIEGVTHVIHFDIPEHPLDYQHRCGRTGRAGQTGISLALSTEYELTWLSAIEKQFGIVFEEHTLQHGKVRPRHAQSR